MTAKLSGCVCYPESSLQWQWSVRGNRLELGPLTLSHAGTYTCLVKNSEGQTKKDYTLTVLGKHVSPYILLLYFDFVRKPGYMSSLYM